MICENNNYCAAFQGCADLSPFKIEHNKTPNAEDIKHEVNSLFCQANTANLKYLFHLMPEQNKRRANLTKEQISILEGSEQSICFGAFACLFPEMYCTLQKGKAIAKLVESKKFLKAKEVTVGILSSLKVGGKLFIPVGSVSHSTVCAVKKVNDDQYELALFDSGINIQGVDCGAASPVFFNLCKNKVCSIDLLDILMRPIESFATEKQQYQDSYPELDLEISLLQGVYEDLESYFEKKPDRIISHFKQRYGTCSTSSLEVAICNYGPLESRKRLIEFTSQKLKSFTALFFQQKQTEKTKENRRIQIKLLNALDC